jgi:hypothetical protein
MRVYHHVRTTGTTGTVPPTRLSQGRLGETHAKALMQNMGVGGPRASAWDSGLLIPYLPWVARSYPRGVAQRCGLWRRRVVRSPPRARRDARRRQRKGSGGGPPTGAREVAGRVDALSTTGAGAACCWRPEGNARCLHVQPRGRAAAWHDPRVAVPGGLGALLCRLLRGHQCWLLRMWWWLGELQRRHRHRRHRRRRGEGWPMSAWRRLRNSSCGG